MGQYGGGRREIIVPCSLWDSLPAAVHASARGGLWGEEVSPIREYGEEEAVSNPVAEKGFNGGPWRGQAFDGGTNCLG